MSTPGKKNVAFQGDHMTPSGSRAFCVYYIGRREIAEINQGMRDCGQRVYPRGHRHALKAGWYWITLADQAARRANNRVGPFTSSRGAYQAAIERLETGKG